MIPTWYDIRGLFILWFSYRTSLIKQVLFFRENIKNWHIEYAAGSGMFYWLCSLFKNNPHIVLMTEMPNKTYSLRRKFKNPLVNIRHFEHRDKIDWFYSNVFNSCNIANAYHCFKDPKNELRIINKLLKPNGTLKLNVLLHPKDGSFADRINKWGRRIGILEKPYYFLDVENTLWSCGFKIKSVSKDGNCCYIEAYKEWSVV